MKERTQKKEYCRPQAEILKMDNEVNLLNASTNTPGGTESETVSGTRENYDGEMVDLGE